MTTNQSNRELLEKAREVLSHIIGAANEAPKFGPFDQIGNDGRPYQSADFHKGLTKGRVVLTEITAALAEQEKDA